MTADQGFYPVETMARVLNVSARRVQQLAQTGIIPRATRGRYDLAGCINGYVRYLRDQAERRAPSDLDQHRARLLEERCHKLKRENDEREAGLIPAAEARLALEMVVAAFEACSQALLRRELVEALAAMNEPAVIRARLKDEVHAVRQAAADRLYALAKANARKH